jgi:hypothetical protein
MISNLGRRFEAETSSDYGDPRLHSLQSGSQWEEDVDVVVTARTELLVTS